MVINLVNIHKSDILYKVNEYPDGQRSIELTGTRSGESASYYIKRYSDPVLIRARIQTFRDIELIICTVAAVRNIYNRKPIELYVPYFMGGRSDRKFSEGGVNYMKDVIGPVINSLNFDRVFVLDPHSYVTESVITNCESLNPIYTEFIRNSLSDIAMNPTNLALISPDAGAYKKVFDIAKTYSIESVYVASKIRDVKSGAIVKTELPAMNLNGIDTIAIIDDICDGGRTFIELAKAIRQQTEIPIRLIVTHGIFSAGLEVMFESFNKIYTTNSYNSQKPDISCLIVTDVF